MWSIIRGSREPQRAFVDSAMDLLAMSSRRLIVGVGVIYILWIAIGVGSQGGRMTLEIMPTTAVIMASFGLAYWLIPRSLAGCHYVWLLGCLMAVTLAILFLRVPEIAFIYCIVPLIAAVTIGWPAAGISVVVVTMLVVWLVTGPATNVLPGSYISLAFFGSLLSAVLGWAATSSLLATVEWSIESYLDAQKEVEESRSQRLELQQVQEDLIQANRELSRLTDRLKTLTRATEEARRVKEEFVANVSHELRTPLNMIIGYTELIIRAPHAYGGKLPPRLLADIGAVQRNSQHLVELINDVLDLSQVDAGRMALSKHWASTKEIIEGAIIAVQPLFMSKGLYLEKHLTPPDLQVYCDSTRMREVVLNLLSNAGRFTERGGVLVKAQCNGNDLIISVTDTGPGISPEDQSKLFEPFQQLDTALHHRTGGNGLGLTISKRFVEMHGGRMWLESEVGKGTTFLFSIAVDPALADAAAPSAGSGLRWLNPYQEYVPRTRTSKAPLQEPGPRMVVVENEDSLHRILSRYLEGVEIQSVQTVDEGVRELERSPAQAIIINTLATGGLPGGMEPNLALPFDTPVIRCWVPGRHEAARRLGVIDYLLKPVQQDDLLGALDNLAGSHENGLNILIVDDDQEALQLFARIISATRARYRVIRATTGSEALLLMRERQPDVVLLDMTLPDLDGFQVLKEKGENPSICAIPVVIVSSTDFTGIPLVANSLTLSRSGGLSVREFLACLKAVTEILAPDSPTYDQVSPKNSPD